MNTKVGEDNTILTYLIVVRIDLEDTPLLVRDLDRLKHRSMLRHSFATGSRARPRALAILACYLLEDVEMGVLCEETELDLIASYVEERGVGLEELADDGLGKGVETRAGDVDEGKGYWEKGNGDLH